MIARSVLILAITLAADAPGPPRSPAPAGKSRYTILFKEGFFDIKRPIDVVGIDGANLATLAASDWDATRWSALLSVKVSQLPGMLTADRKAPSPITEDEIPPVVGRYRIVGNVLRFDPRFPINGPGIKCQIRFRPSLLPHPPAPDAPDVTASFAIRGLPPERLEQAPPAGMVKAFHPPTMSRVYPTSEVVPENLLKLYLHFSAPMSRGEVYDRVRVLDASGRALDRPFLEIGEELWDPSGTRLTLLFDPGRIKRGLKPREELGPILEAGKTYTLVIDRAWPDAASNPLRETFRRTLRAGPPDETQPDPKTWTIDPPAAGTRERLTLTFPEPLDHAMLGHALTVRGIEGQSTIDPGETLWRFRPVRPWPAGTITLVVDTALEDLAGNSIARPFEVDVQRPIGQRVEAEFTTIHTRTR